MSIVRILFLATAGRITRSAWWIGIGALIVFNILLFFVLWMILGSSLIVGLFGRFVEFSVNAINIYAIYCLSVKRFQDRDRSAINAKIVALVWVAKAVHDLFIGDLREPDTFGLLFVFLGTGTALWYFIELGCLEGTSAPNRYGEAAIDFFARADTD